MSDLEHRAWVEEQRPHFVRVQLPVPFLDAHERNSMNETGPAAPIELDRMLLTAWTGAGTAPGANAVAVACPVEQLAALAAYAEECMTSWNPKANYGQGQGMHISAASALATHVRHVIRRESE